MLSTQGASIAVAAVYGVDEVIFAALGTRRACAGTSCWPTRSGDGET